MTLKFKTTGSNDSMYMHVLIFLFGHSILDKIETGEVEVDESELNSLYNYLVVNYNIEYSFEIFKKLILKKEETVRSFLDKNLSLEVEEI